MRINYTLEEFKPFFPEVANLIGSKIPAFITEKEARKHAASIGWGTADIIRLDKRFERVYFVGQRCTYAGGHATGKDEEVIRIPLETFDETKARNVLTIRKAKK